MALYKNKTEAQAIIFDDVQNIVKEIYPILSKIEGKKLLITGANSMVASYFLDTVYYLNEKFFSRKTIVHCFLRKKLTRENRLFYLKQNPYFKFIIADLAKTFKINGKFDYIIHAASSASPKDYLSSPIETLLVNVKATMVILEYLKSHRNCKFLFFSSAEIYGDPGNSRVDENYIGKFNHLSERACYGEAKRFAETLCYFYTKKFVLAVGIARLFHTFGPGIKKNDSRIWSALIFKALEGKNIEIMDASTKRCFCYVADAVKQLWYILICGRNLAVYNVGNPREISIGYFARIVKKIAGSHITITNLRKHEGAWKSSSKRVYPNLDKILKESNIKITTDVEESIRRTVLWCKNFYRL